MLLAWDCAGRLAPLFDRRPAGVPVARLAARFRRAAGRLYDALSKHRDKVVKLVPRHLQGLAAHQIRDRAVAFGRPGLIDPGVAAREGSREPDRL